MHRSLTGILVTEGAVDAITAAAVGWAERLGPRFDSAALERIVVLDPDGRDGLMPQVLDLYAQSMETHRVQIEQAARQGDAEGLRRAAHGLRSASGSVGALSLAAACLQLEHEASARTDGVSGACEALLGQISLVQQDVQRVLGLLQEAGDGSR